MYTILLQAQGSPNPMIGNLFIIGGMIIIVYFFMIRPQQKKTKDQKKFREEIKRGDLVVTIGGIHGRVIAQDDDSITLEVDKGVKLKFDKTSISLEATKKLQSAPATTAAS
ncbi:MAG TPA: preprotein translocase subunit YajC [Cytophagales bacterium]|nr:preprotein translocase subunit YajC [Cytophagales bacterium]